jgi:hypothetical protein
MTHKELKVLLSRMLLNGDFAKHAHQNDNGADSYSCPSCGGYTNIKGHAYGPGPIGEVEHTDCDLVTLTNEIWSWED